MLSGQNQPYQVAYMVLVMIFRVYGYNGGGLETMLWDFKLSFGIVAEIQNG